MTTDPQLKYLRELRKMREEELAFALKVEKIRRRRDIGMSLAQSLSMNPTALNATIGLLGATISTAGGTARSYANRDGKTRVPTWLGKTDIEVAGEGLMVLAGVRLTTDAAAEILKAIRGANTSQSIAFDIPDSEGPALLQASPVAGYFPTPGHPAPARTRSAARRART